MSFVDILKSLVQQGSFEEKVDFAYSAVVAVADTAGIVAAVGTSLVVAGLVAGRSRAALRFLEGQRAMKTAAWQ